MTSSPVCLAVLLAAPLAAQVDDPVAALREAYTRAERARQADATPQSSRAEYAAALDCFLRLDPQSEAYREWLPVGAFCAEQAERADLAVRLYGEAVERQSDAASVGGLLRALLAAGQLETVVQRGRAFEAEFSESVAAVVGGASRVGEARLLEAAGRWLREGRTDDALWVFETAVRASGEHPIALANLGLALRRLGRAEVCEATYRRALAKAPEDHLIWNDFGLFLKSAGRLDDAEEAFLESRRRDPNGGTGPATTNLGLMAVQHGRRPVDPLVELSRLLAERPEADMARRVTLDLLTDRAFRPTSPDRAGSPR